MTTLTWANRSWVRGDKRDVPTLDGSAREPIAESPAPCPTRGDETTHLRPEVNVGFVLRVTHVSYMTSVESYCGVL